MSLESCDSWGGVAGTMQKKEYGVNSGYFGSTVRPEQSGNFMSHILCNKTRTSGNVKVKIRMILVKF